MKNVYLLILILLALLSFTLSLLYFSNPKHRKEKIDEYKEKIEKRLHRNQ